MDLKDYNKFSSLMYMAPGRRSNSELKKNENMLKQQIARLERLNPNIWKQYSRRGMLNAIRAPMEYVEGTLTPNERSQMIKLVNKGYNKVRTKSGYTTNGLPNTEANYLENNGENALAEVANLVLSRIPIQHRAGKGGRYVNRNKLLTQGYSLNELKLREPQLKKLFTLKEASKPQQNARKIYENSKRKKENANRNKKQIVQSFLLNKKNGTTTFRALPKNIQFKILKKANFNIRT